MPKAVSDPAAFSREHITVTYKSPYSSRSNRSRQGSMVWPIVVGGLIIALVILGGGLGLYFAGVRLSLARPGEATATAAPSAVAAAPSAACRPRTKREGPWRP